MLLLVKEMLAQKLYITIQKLRGRFKDTPNIEVEAALSGDPGAISLIYAQKIINLEEYNLLQISSNYRHQIKPVDNSEGRQVFKSIYDLLLIYDHRDLYNEYIFRGHADATWSYLPSEARLKTSQEIETNKLRVLKNGLMDAISQPVEHKIKEEN